MAKIIMAKNAGFCFGVKRAVDSVLENLEKYDKLYTYGEIIHNKDVVQMLANKGVVNIDDLEGKENINLIIRSHGVPKSIYEYCEKNNINIIDNTCPFVKRIHKMVYKSEIPVIIIGESTHPEIIGIKGWTEENSLIINSIEEANSVPCIESCLVVAQTTLNKDYFEKIVNIIKNRVKNPIIYNTICNATSDRQIEAIEIAKKADLMVVIGGKHSSNSKKLNDICKNYCKRVVFIENVEDLILENIKTSDIIGVVAGASTPDWIIREVLTTMSDLTNNEPCCGMANAEGSKENATQNHEGHCCSSEKESIQVVEDKDSFFADLEKSLRKIRVNEIVTGCVVQVNKNEIFISFGYKSDGIIPRNEYSNDPSVDLSTLVNVGDKIEAQVVKLNDGEGNVLLSVKKLANKKVWNDLEEKFQDADAVYSVCCKEVVKGGVIADLDGVKIFIPASLIDVRFVKDLNQFIGKTFDIKVVEFDKAKKKIVGNRKVLLQAEQEAKKTEIWSKFNSKQEVEGVVKRITDFGAFVDIGGIDGLLHVADIAWYRIEHPSDVLKVNDKIKVVILSVNKEKERISLGLKQLQAKPWEDAGNKYTEGQVVKGKVVRILDFGAFVELEPGIDGLVHISQISLEHVNKVEDKLNIGDEVECKIISVDAGSKKISLSIKELLRDNSPQDDDYYDEDVEDDTFIPEITESSVTLSEFLPDGFLDELNEE